MIILGINEGHEASAALMIDGKIVSANQEERFSKIKCDYGLPLKAISECLKSSKVLAQDIDEVAVASQLLNPVLIRLKRNANFSIEDNIEEQEKFWKPYILYKKKVDYWKIFRNKKFIFDKYYNFKNISNAYHDNKDMIKFRDRRIDAISSYVNVSKDIIKLYVHEECHKNYSFYFFPKREDGLALTCESIGDYSNGSVSDIKKGKFLLKAHTKENRLGHIYKYITLLLGMKPGVHEYKVMGLAPYASSYEINKCYGVFDKILKVSKLNLVHNKKPKDLFFHFKEKLKACRFDGIAGALQNFLENKLLDWFLSCGTILKKDIFYFSGGVAQNIKAGLFLSKNKSVKKIYIPPAAGDSTISIGACFLAATKYCENKNINPIKYIKSIDNLYLGYCIKEEDVIRHINKFNLSNKYKIQKNYKPQEVARMLSVGKVIGRCSGKMEFGLRALGNRSILCDPRNINQVSKINQKIKKRDFWMPFTPTILFEDRKKYIINNKFLEDRFMSMAFETTQKAQKEIPAALHPADHTARPQILKKRHNPEYYELIRQFKKITGVGALLNTSFNLHGLPIVCDTKDAFHVFENSELDAILVENYMFIKK